MSQILKNIHFGCVILIILSSVVSAEIITWTGNVTTAGTINGSSVAGQTVTVAVEILDGRTFNGGVFDTGIPISLTYTFSGFGVFAVDSAFLADSVIGGAGQELFFVDDGVVVYTAGTSDNNELPAGNDGETIAAYLARTGGTFTGDAAPGLVVAGVTGNGGIDSITQLIFVASGTNINVVTSVPEPRTYVLLLILALAALSIRRNTKQILPNS